MGASRNRDSNSPFPLGEFVKRRRAELDMNQVELADRAGISQSFLSQIERGQIELPRDRKQRRLLADALRVGHLDLLMHAGIIDRDDLPSGAGPPVVSSKTQDKLDKLPAEARRAIENFVDLIYRSSKDTHGDGKPAHLQERRGRLRKVRRETKPRAVMRSHDGYSDGRSRGSQA